MTYPDESGTTGVWRVLPAENFDAWLQAQSSVPQTIRYIVDHHTWSPDATPQDPSRFLAQVKGIFRNYYEVPEAQGGRGWKRDHGPQLWLGVIAGEPWVVIAANLQVHGPHCAYFNGCSVGIETMWNGDRVSWSEPVYQGLYLIHRAFERRLGIPLARGVTGPTNTNIPTKTGKGWLFHRDALKSGKSCPGTRNTHDALQAAFGRYAAAEKEDELNDKERAALEDIHLKARQDRVTNVTHSNDTKALLAQMRGNPAEADRLLEDAYVKGLKEKTAQGLDLTREEQAKLAALPK